ncbi:MAG: hypothetical protein FJ411_06985, partial [Verrucomicrobia bacterium]|nr:hypothetical protein [Verrucomicrobiota bacterium]
MKRSRAMEWESTMRKLFAFIFLLPMLAWAQSLLSVSVASFVADQRARVDVAGVVHSDLGRSGLFNLIHTGTAIAETGPLPTELQGRGVDMLVSGSVSRLANGR